jgi:hypothetical protein
MNPDFMVELYKSLQTYCSAPDFDAGVFRLKHDEYAKRYQKLTYEQQGEIAERVNYV